MALCRVHCQPVPALYARLSSQTTWTPHCKVSRAVWKTAVADRWERHERVAHQPSRPELDRRSEWNNQCRCAGQMAPGPGTWRFVS